jgi:hypothetical protein
MLLANRIPSYGIDLDADPVSVPEGFEIVEHVRGGVLAWTPTKPQIVLHLTPEQRKGIVPGAKLFADLEAFEGLRVNANALDYFLQNLPAKPWLIPSSWSSADQHKTKHILFWGTRYRFEGSICVRSLDWIADVRSRGWKAGYCWADNQLNSQFPAAMLSKPAVPPSAENSH